MLLTDICWADVSIFFSRFVVAVFPECLSVINACTFEKAYAITGNQEMDKNLLI